jgi:tyrosine-protein kinase Etk/Wzc
MSALHQPVQWENPSEMDPAAGAGLSPEVFRQVYTSLGLAQDARPVIGITSAIRGEGRTTAAVGLASTLAADLGIRVLLVDVDLDRPALAQLFNLPSVPGLADVLRSEGHLLDFARPVSDNLWVVPAGETASDSARLLHQLPRCDPFHTVQAGPEVTILDLPPIMNFSYGPLAAQRADAVLLVVRAGVTPGDVVREAVARLEDRPPRGVVLNGARRTLPSWWPDTGK